MPRLNRLRDLWDAGKPVVNGWLSLGINAQPSAAWNPIAGFNDPFGRLLWFALGDPAVLPAPNDSGWTINRIADVQSSSGK